MNHSSLRTWRRTVLLDNLWQARWGVLIVAFILAGPGYLFLDHLATRRDIRDAPELRAVCVVDSVADLPTGRSSSITGGLVFLRLRGKTLSVATPLRNYPVLRAGQTVEATYQIGKSGRVVVSWIRPVTDARR